MNKAFLFMTAIMASVFAGCSSDEPTAPGFDETYNDQAYMRVRIAMADDAAARADDEFFQNGTAEEQKIKEIGLKFYNADGSFYGYGIPVENPTYNTSTTTEGSSVGGTIEDAVVVLQINSNAPKPTHVVAYVNCGDNWKQLGSEPGIDIADEGKSSITIKYEDDGTEYYAMTSSNFINATGTGAEAFGYRTPINPDSFKPTAEGAMQSANSVDIYVERLAAKVKVNVAPKMKPATIENNGYTLDFVIDGYSLGGVNNTSYFVKKLDSSWKDVPLWTGWNNYDLHRCYWARDINYDNAINTPPALNYVSYNEVKNSLPGSVDQWIYTAENTLAGMSVPATSTATQEASGTEDVTKLNRYLFQPFVYVIGHYVVTKDGKPVTDGNLYECAGKILTWNVMLEYLQQIIGTVLYTKDGDTYSGVNLLSPTAFVTLGSYSVNGKKDASLVCLQLTDYGKSEIASGKYYIKKQDGTDPNKYDYVKAEESNVVPLLKQSETQVYGFKYDEGVKGYLAYFPVLIKHLNTGINANEASTGYYGVVRNHCYYITINKIEGLGIGIFDPDVDIIPEDKIKPLYLAAKFNVLSWRVVQQGVDL